MSSSEDEFMEQYSDWEFMAYGCGYTLEEFIDFMKKLANERKCKEERERKQKQLKEEERIYNEYMKSLKKKEIEIRENHSIYYFVEYSIYSPHLTGEFWRDYNSGSCNFTPKRPGILVRDKGTILFGDTKYTGITRGAFDPGNAVYAGMYIILKDVVIKRVTSKGVEWIRRPLTRDEMEMIENGKNIPI